ncbi:MAG TPA: sigma 54-interacting transcriptional regulator [Gemmataceae bacterium]|jgi:PAS domain S-box-containing protein|nr:sigma 54-interacting transcriptional regulator [Gemmataceae bacterium]
MNETPASPDTPSTDELVALRAIVEGTARHTGQEFFQCLVRHLAAAVGTRYAFVAEFAGGTRARTLAFWFRDRITDNIEWDVIGTPCQDVVRGNLCHYPTGVRERFPDDRPLVEWGIASYLGVPLCDAQGRHLGHLAVFDERPMPAEPRKLFTFRIFAARAVAELERLQFEKQLMEREEQYRDLFEEAPIGYIKQDLQSRFITANRAALRILGLQPEEVAGTLGMSLVADTPDAQRRIREVFASAGRGTDTGGVVLELRRKDDGRPVWVQRWSRPEPNGKYTRTVIVDITEHVLMEQEKARLQQQNLYLQEEIKSVHDFEQAIGRSPALMAVLDNVRSVAATDATVLITGETGTGKELIARAIHSSSRRKEKPLIKINCAALPAGLVESELFGHEKGAFTGAIARRIGRFELAHGGTIFLDEIGELPADAQAKLLRVLQEREFDRVGGTAPIQVDVRVLAASNRDLLKAVREKTFREDLYYRLSVFPLQLPPLRDRKEDIPPLAHFLVNKFAARIGKRIDGIDKETMRRLIAYPWPGNIRELENVIERAVILAAGPALEIGADVLPVNVEPSACEEQAPEQPATLEATEREHIFTVLRQTGWVVEGSRGAAKILGLHPNTLRSRMKKLGIRRPAHDPS